MFKGRGGGGRHGKYYCLNMQGSRTLCDLQLCVVTNVPVFSFPSDTCDKIPSYKQERRKNNLRRMIVRVTRVRN